MKINMLKKKEQKKRGGYGFLIILLLLVLLGYDFLVYSAHPFVISEPDRLNSGYFNTQGQMVATVKYGYLYTTGDGLFACAPLSPALPNQELSGYMDTSYRTVMWPFHFRFLLQDARVFFYKYQVPFHTLSGNCLPAMPAELRAEGIPFTIGQ